MSQSSSHFTTDAVNQSGRHGVENLVEHITTH